LNSLVGNEIELGILIPMIKSRMSIGIKVTNGMICNVMGSNDDCIFVEFIGVAIVLHNTLAIIDQREMSRSCMCYSRTFGKHT
jgi:hypothetical protein